MTREVGAVKPRLGSTGRRRSSAADVESPRRTAWESAFPGGPPATWGSAKKSGSRLGRGCEVAGDFAQVPEAAGMARARKARPPTYNALLGRLLSGGRPAYIRQVQSRLSGRAYALLVGLRRRATAELRIAPVCETPLRMRVNYAPYLVRNLLHFVAVLELADGQARISLRAALKICGR